MCGINLKKNEYFGREITSFKYKNTILYSPSNPLNFYLKDSNTNNIILFASSTNKDSTKINYFTEIKPALVLIDGERINFRWKNNFLIFSISKGIHEIIIKII